MKIKKKLTHILLFVVFAWIPIWPYFTYSRYDYIISWWCYIIVAIMSIGILCWLLGEFIWWIIVQLIKIKTKSSKNIPNNNLSIKRSLILLGLSALGYFCGPNILPYVQMNKYNYIIKKSTLFEEQNGRKPIDLRELNLNDKILKSRLFSNGSSSMDLNDENCKAKFIYKTAVIFNFDTDCIVICCLGKPKNGIPYKFVANGYGDYKWYRFCYI